MIAAIAIFMSCEKVATLTNLLDSNGETVLSFNSEKEMNEQILQIKLMSQAEKDIWFVSSKIQTISLGLPKLL